MSDRKARSPISDQILEEATSWFIDNQTGELDAPGRERFNEWLRRSPQHVRAYLEIAAAWQDASGLSRGRPLDREALITAALAESNVVNLDVGAPDAQWLPRERQQHSWRERIRRSSWAIAASTVIAAIALAYLMLQNGNTYQTAVGEQRSIILSDGSTVELNARSRLHVRFSQSERKVELEKGQALFRVKKDSRRPFVVLSGETQVLAVGTQFDVYRKATGTVITVVEGRVAITPPTVTPVSQATPTPIPVLLSAGEQLTVSSANTSKPHTANVQAATAWTQRRLVFDATPLQEAITEYNRYIPHPLVIDAPALESYHIRGTFDATDPDRLIQFLRERFGAEVTDDGRAIHVRIKKSEVE